MERFPRLAVDTSWGPMTVRQRTASGKPLVFLHGIGGNADSWRKQYAAFDSSFRVIGWDAPGYGGSFDFPDETPALEDYASALAALLEALKLEQAVVVGHSLGALIAACAAAKFPARFERLVLAACSSGHATYEPSRREAMLKMRLDAFSGGDPSAYARSRMKNLFSPEAAPEVLEEAVGVMAQIKQPGFPQATRMVSASDIFPYLGRIKAPTRVICGTDDMVTPATMNIKIAESIAGADFIPIEGAGHWLHLEFADQFNEAVRSFVR
jgi:pimeloyl-ACP methyl ester carboxylesterase